MFESLWSGRQINQIRIIVMNENTQSQSQDQGIKEKKPWYKKWWAITLGVIILISIVGNSEENKSAKQAAQEQNQPEASTVVDTAKPETESKQIETTTEPAKKAPDVTVTSSVLSKDYSENEVAADAKYKGKLIEVSGKVTGVDNGLVDNEMIVKLSDGQYDIAGPWCYMKDNEKDKVLQFKKGQQVTLIGMGNSATIGSPILKDFIAK